MLTITIKGDELFNEEDNTFFTTEDVVLEMEHSLISLSKWESIHQKPFLANNNKTAEELFDYIVQMVLTPNVSVEKLRGLSPENIEEIKDYLESKQSATTFGMMPETRGKGETITSELIYYWMVAFQIPFECERWHLNRLFALIRICNIKQQKPQKMSKSAISQRYAELNAQRRAASGSSG